MNELQTHNGGQIYVRLVRNESASEPYQDSISSITGMSYALVAEIISETFSNLQVGLESRENERPLNNALVHCTCPQFIRRSSGYFIEQEIIIERTFRFGMSLKIQKKYDELNLSSHR